MVDGGDRELQKEVMETLWTRRIECQMVGSIGYAVMVPRSRLVEARKLLERASELGPSKIRFPDKASGRVTP
jgi:hypothetical protein